MDIMKEFQNQIKQEMKNQINMIICSCPSNNINEIINTMVNKLQWNLMYSMDQLSNLSIDSKEIEINQKYVMKAVFEGKAGKMLWLFLTSNIFNGKVSMTSEILDDFDDYLYHKYKM